MYKIVLPKRYQLPKKKKRKCKRIYHDLAKKKTNPKKQESFYLKQLNFKHFAITDQEDDFSTILAVTRNKDKTIASKPSIEIHREKIE